MLKDTLSKAAKDKGPIKQQIDFNIDLKLKTNNSKKK